MSCSRAARPYSTFAVPMTISSTQQTSKVASTQNDEKRRAVYPDVPQSNELSRLRGAWFYHDGKGKYELLVEDEHIIYKEESTSSEGPLRFSGGWWQGHVKIGIIRLQLAPDGTVVSQFKESSEGEWEARVIAYKAPRSNSHVASKPLNTTACEQRDSSINLSALPNKKDVLDRFLKELDGTDVLDYGRDVQLIVPKDDEVQWWRQRVLLETLTTIKNKDVRESMRAQAMENVARWRREVAVAKQPCQIRVIEGDWGDVTADLTREFGAVFAVLNMAHPICPGGGGGYVNGTVAQEENMMRRTDCHFGLQRHTMERTPVQHMNVVPQDFLYKKDMTKLIEGVDGEVYMSEETHFCFRGPERNFKEKIGYEHLPADQWFPFIEMRAAAVDLRYKSDMSTRTREEMHEAFDEEILRARIKAQFETLKRRGQRFTVLGAFGCGAFGNPTRNVAELYKDVIEKDFSDEDFDVVAFAIFYAGYGPRENFDIFSGVLQNML